MRIRKFDNIKCLGILLIVFGHMLEALECGYIGECLHMIIYSFHIPLFIFVMGVFAKRKKNDWLRVFVLYLIIQTLYLMAFNVKHIMAGEYLLLDYTVPFWLAWYLMVMLIYKLITPGILMLSQRFKVALLIGSIALALFSSFIPHLGYRFSLIRAVTFLPYFIFGIIWQKTPIKVNRYLISVMAVICSIGIAAQSYVDINVLYGVGGAPAQRIIVCITSFTWILFLMTWVPDSKISDIVSKIGRNTLPIFLFHGLVIKVVFTFWTPSYGAVINMIIGVAFSFLLCITFAQDTFTKILSLKWIIK